MTFSYKVVEVAQNTQGYRYQLQMVNGGQSNGNMNIFSETQISGYVLNAVVTVTVGTPAA